MPSADDLARYHETAEAEDEVTEPGEDDYTLCPTGPLGGLVAVCQYGECLGTFVDYDTALRFVRKHADAAQYWPDVWIMSDHGNAHRTVMPPTAD